MMSANRAQTGPLNHNWKGGRTITQHGYVLIKMPDHHRADVRGYVYEHIMVAEEKMRRPIFASEQVHHEDENGLNNHPDNLTVKASLAEHRAAHRKHDHGLRLPGEDNPTIQCICGCGKVLARYDGDGRPRTYISGHNPRSAPSQDAVMGCLLIGSMHRQEIARMTGMPVKRVASILSRLWRSGDVTSSGEGFWTIRQLCYV